jgi:hypothetical protein
MSSRDRYPKSPLVDGMLGSVGLPLLVTAVVAFAAVLVANAVSSPRRLIGAKPSPLAAVAPERVRQSSEETELEKVPEVGLERVATGTELFGAFAAAKQRHQNGSDAYVDALAAERGELAGLPFLRGDRCKLDRSRAMELGRGGTSLRGTEAINESTAHFSSAAMSDFPYYLISDYFHEQAYAAEGPKPIAGLPAAMQILAVQDPAFRTAIVRTLERVPVGENAKVDALVRLVLFDPDADVRAAAIRVLGPEPVEKYGPKLIDGFRHPWHVVAERTAEAIYHLRQDELLPMVADFLDEPDPAAPFEREAAGKKEFVVREMAKINHHRNCLLCHAPAVEDDPRQNSGLIAKVPAPDEKLPPAISREYYHPSIDGPAIIATETYLRQDFSVMLTVGNPGIWPSRQRFDFLVRTRTAAPDEAAAARRASPAPDGARSANHRVALGVLRRMTSTDAGTKSADWRTAIARRLDDVKQ